MRVLACLLLMLAAPAVQAQMYKCTQGGKTRYSDKPITDCKSVEVKGKANTYAGTPTPERRRRQVPKEQVQHDSRCSQLQREHAALQRAPDSAAREQRLTAMRSEFAGCN